MNRLFKANLPLTSTFAWYSILILAAAVIAGCNRGADARNSAEAATKNTAPNQLPRVQTIAVRSQDLAHQIELPGTVEGYETADLYAKVGGYLAEISVDIGDPVYEGQVLARLSIPEMQKELREKLAAIAAAEADVSKANAALYEAKSELHEKEALLGKQRAEFERIEGLVARGSLQDKLLDEAKYARDAAQAGLVTARARIQTAEAVLESSAAQVELAKAERDTAQTLLQYGEIRAPFDGIVTKRFVDPGAFIQPAAGNSSARPLLTVSRIDVVRIWLDLPMAEVRWLDRGDRVVFDRINVLPGAKFEGEVARFATALDPTSRMMRVEIDLPNAEHELLPGYYGYVTLVLDEMPQTAVVPSSAIFKSGTDTCVFVVEDGVCHKRVVTTSFQDGTILGIESGLRAGEEVVQAGAGQLRDGQQVVAVNAGT